MELVRNEPTRPTQPGPHLCLRSEERYSFSSDTDDPTVNIASHHTLKHKQDPKTLLSGRRGQLVFSDRKHDL